MTDLTQLVKANHLFIEQDRDVPLMLHNVFLFVCEHNGCLKQEIEWELGVKKSSSSRLIQWLGDHKFNGKPGLGLVYTRKDVEAENYRRLRVYLTPEGKQLRDQIRAAVWA